MGTCRPMSSPYMFPTSVFHVVSGCGRIGRISRTMATLETGQDPPYEASEHREDTVLTKHNIGPK